MSAPDLPLVTLRDLHTGMLASLLERYGERVASIAGYDPFSDLGGQERRALVTPALLLELQAIEPGEDDGTDRQPLRLVWGAHCVLSMRTTDIQVELREFAADVLGYVRNHRWGYPGAVREPQDLNARPGEFRPELAGFDSWLVSWEQLAYLGPDVWSAAGIAPTTVWVGIAPEIGTAFAGAYQQIDDLADD